MLLEPFVLPGTATVSTPEILDQWEYFSSENAPADGYWLYDGVHPTAAVHELINKAWLEAFETIQ